MPAKKSTKSNNKGGLSGCGNPPDRMSAAPPRSSNIADNDSGAKWLCEYCGREFDTKIGVGVHKSSLHRDELNSERLSQTRPSRGVGLRNAVSSRRLWTNGEIKTLVKLDLELRRANPDASERSINDLLQSKLLDRSAEAIKGQKKGATFRRIQAEMLTAQLDAEIAELDEQVGNNNSSGANDPEAVVVDGAEGDLGETVEIHASGETGISSIEETRLNHVDHELLARLRDATRQYAGQIKRNIKSSYKVEQLLHILGMNRGNPNASILLEKWLMDMVDMNGGGESDLRIPNRGRKPKIREGYGQGRGLRRRKWLQEKAYLQNLYERRGVKGIAEHVLRDVDEIGGSTPTVNHTPTSEAMVEFWSDVFGANTRGGKKVETNSDEDSTANCLWSSINSDDIKESEMASGKAKGPDGVSVAKWKSVPRSVRALFYNVVLFHGVVLERLSKARTVFIPKSTIPSDAGDYRPIGITSVIRRQLHRIFANRLKRVRKFDDRQMAFRNGIDGVSNNLATLRTIVETARSGRRNLHMVSLDLKKAFDTVSYESIFETMANLKCPTVFVNYLKRLCSTASTCLELGNDKSTIRIGRGVLQGDPLSPMIFNHIIDRALKKLDEDMGYLCGADSVTCTAFADDINVIGDSIVGTQSNVDILLSELAGFGLQANPSKCLSLSMIRKGQNGARVLDTKDRFKINGEIVKSINPCTPWKYLGINWIGEKIDKHLPDIRPKLDRVKNALLKPQQKLEVITKVILPGIFHQAILGNASQEELSSIDVHVRNVVREIMHFPHDIPISYIHAPVRCGGMGVPELLIRIPLLRYKRMTRFAISDAKVAPAFDRSIAYRHNKEKVEDFLRENDLVLEVHDTVIPQYYLARLEDNYATRGLSEAFYSRQSRGWCNSWANEISGGDFIKYHLISSCSLPTLARRAWGRTGKDVRCRHGCESIETLHHVQQECSLTKGGRSLRHDRILDFIHNSMVSRFEGRFNIEKEPNIQTEHGLRKPDLLLHGGSDAIVIDLNIVGKENMKRARENKVAKYRDLDGFTRLIKNRYEAAEVSYYAITISYCGIIERLSRELLRKLEFTNRDVFRMTTSVLRGSWLSWFQFKKQHQQRFFELRNQT